MTTFRSAHRIAVLASIDLVHTVRRDQLALTTPCAGWNLGDLLTHMTVQHHGFAAAARGLGSDLGVWRVESVTDRVTLDPAGSYAEAAHDVLAAFDAVGVDEAPFALPEFGPDAVFPGSMAMSFHFIDYVVHGWDVAATLGAPLTLPADVTAAALPLALAVPDGDFRTEDGSPFARAVEPTDDTDMNRILRHLGRRPDWAQPYSTVTGAWSDQRNA